MKTEGEQPANANSNDADKIPEDKGSGKKSQQPAKNQTWEDKDKDVLERLKAIDAQDAAARAAAEAILNQDQKRDDKDKDTEEGEPKKKKLTPEQKAAHARYMRFFRSLSSMNSPKEVRRMGRSAIGRHLDVNYIGIMRCINPLPNSHAHACLVSLEWQCISGVPILPYLIVVDMDTRWEAHDCAV